VLIKTLAHCLLYLLQNLATRLRNHQESNMTEPLKPEVFPFYDKQTSTFSYIVKDPTSNACAVIDSVLNLDYNSGRITHKSADEIIDHICRHNLELQWQIETHVHADHLSAAPYIQQKLGGKLGIGSHITTVQNVFGKVFNAGMHDSLDRGCSLCGRYFVYARRRNRARRLSWRRCQNIVPINQASPQPSG
jgi:glyoxylase-like metal-dependent hydrolase (beta-lactamase superfamily II)